MGNNKYKILIVEDEANIRSFIKANLETSDYQVLCAETCELGMMMYASHHPDLILLDLGLPDRDGMSLIQEVRETDTVPIIVLSARSNERDKVEALDLGANDYITKPFGTEELLARIRAVLRSHRHSKDLAENMIRLSGVQGIEIIETGLRPGEKLYEELLVKTEELDKTDNSLIFIERDTALSKEEIYRKIDVLRNACDTGDDLIAKEALRSVVPTFKTPEEVNKEIA